MEHEGARWHHTRMHRVHCIGAWLPDKSIWQAQHRELPGMWATRQRTSEQTRCVLWLEYAVNCVLHELAW